MKRAAEGGEVKPLDGLDDTGALATGTGLMALEVMGLHQWASLVLSAHVTPVMPDRHLALLKPRAAQIAYCGRPLPMRSCME
jgi:hypothetical protein